MRSKAAIACVTSFMVTWAPFLPKTCLKAFTYVGVGPHDLQDRLVVLQPHLTGLTKGCCDWSSRLGERPSQNMVSK